jgi:transcriptional regulator with XRE-family HTH domain
MTNTDTPKQVHHGRNVKRIREMLGVKQEALAAELGEDWNQRRISTLEQRDIIEPELIEQLAKALKVPEEAIKNFTEETAVTFISSTFNHSGLFNYSCTLNFNPLDKFIETVEEVKKLNEKNEKLFEALLKSEREKVAMLEKLLNDKKK